MNPISIIMTGTAIFAASVAVAKDKLLKEETEKRIKAKEYEEYAVRVAQAACYNNPDYVHPNDKERIKQSWNSNCFKNHMHSFMKNNM